MIFRKVFRSSFAKGQKILKKEEDLMFDFWDRNRDGKLDIFEEAHRYDVLYGQEDEEIQERKIHGDDTEYEDLDENNEDENNESEDNDGIDVKFKNDFSFFKDNGKSDIQSKLQRMVKYYEDDDTDDDDDDDFDDFDSDDDFDDEF